MTVKFALQKAHDRAKELQKAPQDKLNNCSQELKLVHKDRTKIKYSSCYFELMSFPNPNDETEILNCVVIAPEHHPAAYYELEDLSELVETKYVGKKNKKKKVDLLKQEKKK